jgi:hypothetical protein
MAKRLLAILVCMMMTLSLMAGCVNTPKDATAPTASVEATTAPAETSSEPEATASAPAVAEKKEVTISWSGIMDPAGDDFGKWMMSNFKIKLNMVAIDNIEKVKMLAASDSLPDLIGGMGVGDATYSSLRPTV